MNIDCPHCEKRDDFVFDNRMVVRKGSFWRTSDSRSVKRYRCLRCNRSFSQATRDPCLNQKKRQKNALLSELISSGVSQRRIARLLRINRKMVARRVIFLGARARFKLEFETAFLRIAEFEFDDMETFEHSKCKPLSIPLAVEFKTRRILGFKVARMRAKGPLTKKSLKLYGKLPEERRKRRRELFNELKPILRNDALIRTDSNPYYVDDIKELFPHARHKQVKGRRGALTGQGELKKVGFDPIFSLNHTAAMLRANLANLIRKTWCTTKKMERLADRIAIYACYHNEHLA